MIDLVPADTICPKDIGLGRGEHWGQVCDGGLLGVLLDVLIIVGLVGQVSVVWVWDLVGVTLTIA